MVRFPLDALPDPPQRPNAWHQQSHLVDSLRLARTDRIGPTTFKLLMRSFETPTQAIAALPEFYKKGLLKPLKIVDAAHINKEIDKTQALGGHYFIYGSVDYPILLAHTPSAPAVLTALGHESLLKRPCLALVGARNASAAAQSLAQKISHDLGQHDIVCVSGLARGIDTQVHKATLDSGTIAILGNGIDIYYPAENKALQNRIQETGLILTEHPPETAPQAHHFPRRNRIIAGISIATLVIEAARRSGSLITARLAADFGRSVMAVPGSPVDPRCHGSNHLLRDGAILIETADDILEALETEMNMMSFKSPAAPVVPRTDYPTWEECDEKELSYIRNLLGPTPISVADLADLANIPMARLSLYLLLLDLEGQVSYGPDGRICTIENPTR